MENRQFLGNTELLEEVDFRHFFLLIRRNLGWLLGVLILSGAGAFLFKIIVEPLALPWRTSPRRSTPSS